MRNATLVLAVVVLAGALCTSNAGKQSPAASADWPKEALGQLSEEELTRLVNALPALNGALRAAKWETQPQREGTSPLSTLTDLVEGMAVAGVNESLRLHGGWAKVRPALYKVFAATAALVIDRASPEMVERMRQDTSAAGKKGVADYEFFKSACTQVPEANKQLVAKYQEQLQPLGSLGR